MARKPQTSSPLTEAGYLPSTEAALQERIVDLFVAYGAVVVRVNSGRKGRIAFVRWFARSEDPKTAGVSDLVVTLGRTVYVEVKMPGETLRPDQKLFAERTRQAGGEYYVVRSVNEAQDLANTLQEER